MLPTRIELVTDDDLIDGILQPFATPRAATAYDGGRRTRRSPRTSQGPLAGRRRGMLPGMWSDVVLERGPGGEIADAARAGLMARSEAEVAAAVAWVDAHEDLVASLASDRSRDDEARASFREAQRVRELLRVRAYSIEASRTWVGLGQTDQDALLGRVERAGLDRSADAAITAIGMILNQLVVARLVALATATKNAEASVGEAMVALPIRFQLDVIAETGGDLRVPGEVLRDPATDLRPDPYCR